LGCITRHGNTLWDLELGQPEPLFARLTTICQEEEKLLPSMLAVTDLERIRDACPHVTNFGVDLDPKLTTVCSLCLLPCHM
jgi:hypothetical protein